MWWYFRKKKEDEKYIYYNYSRESRICDGLIRYDKTSDIAEMVKPCSVDTIDFDIDVACQKMYHVVKDNFPDTRMVACG